MAVDTTHADYDRFARKWKRARDCVAGTDAIHAAGEEYLPKLKDEDSNGGVNGYLASSNDDGNYRSRLKRSDFFNGTWRTIDALGGMAFRKPPTVDVPGSIEGYLNDVTMSGMSMESLAKECVEEVLGPGRIGVLVDHPVIAENVSALSVRTAEKLGLRPTLKLYLAETIRNWKFARIANAWVLSMVVLGEAEPVAKDEFTDEIEDRYRVLDLIDGTYRQRVFKVDKHGKDELLSETVPLMNGKPLTFIPFAIIGTGGRNDHIDEPPLIDLVDANLALYQMNAIYRHTLYFCPPTFYIAGYSLSEGETISIGGTAALVFPDPNAKAAFAEPEGNLIPELRNAMLDKKQEMALLGARMLADETKQVETLGATQIKRAGENSVLAKIVQSVSEGLEWALGVFAEWAGQKGKIVYQINRDFMPAMMDAQTMQALLAARIANEITPREYFDLLQRGDVIDPAKQFEEHQREKDEEAPNPARPTPRPGEAVAA
jgi:hypothetical protein